MNPLEDPLLYDMNNSGHLEVKDFLQQCRLLQYLDTFIAEGFESLPAVCITWAVAVTMPI